jgi:hypothetical protein
MSGFTYHVYVNGRTFTVGPIARASASSSSIRSGTRAASRSSTRAATPVIVGAIEDNATDTTPTLGTFYFSKLALTGGSNPQTLCQPASYSPTGHDCHVFVPMVLTGFTPLNVHIAWQLGASVNAVTFTHSARDP